MNPLQQPQPPVFNDKIPMEAQALMMQPEAVNMLRQLNGFDLISLFYFQMPFMLLPKEINSLEKKGQKLLSYTGASLLLGIVLNVQVKRISMNFLKLPFYVRYPVRLGIMALAFAPFYSSISEKGTELLGLV